MKALLLLALVLPIAAFTPQPPPKSPFRSIRTIATPGHRPNSLAAADIDGDGNLDLLVGSNEADDLCSPTSTETAAPTPSPPTTRAARSRCC